MIDEVKEEKLKDFMNRISFVLKNTTLQQGFEIICKKLAELEKENGKLQGKIADLESEYYELENSKDNEIEKLKAQIERMKCCGNCINHNDLCYCELDRKEVNANNVCNKWEWEKEE